MAVGPLFAGLPQSLHTAAKLTTGIDLLPDQFGLLRCKEARTGLACYSLREAVVRTVARLGVLRTSATWFAALDRTFGQGAAAHGGGIGQLRRELTDMGRHIRSSSRILPQGYGRGLRCRIGLASEISGCGTPTREHLFLRPAWFPIIVRAGRTSIADRN